MKKTETEYITFEQASLLKEKGFDEECKTVFYQADNAEICVEDFIEDETIGGYYTKRAEQYKVVEWLRINYGEFISTEIYLGKYRYVIYKVNNTESCRTAWRDNKLFDSPKEAYSAAFNFILNTII